MSLFQRMAACCLLVLGVAAFAHSPVMAAIGAPYDVPTLSCVSSGETEITLKVTAGASGAPAGVTIQWMTQDDYNLNGWGSVGDPGMCALSLSGQPSYTGNTTTKWELGANEFFEIKIGSLNLEETGLSVHGEGCDGDLKCGTTYVFRVFAHATNEHKKSAFSGNTECTTADCPAEDCTLTFGAYRNNGPGACAVGADPKNFWPASVLTANGMQIGVKFYSLTELCYILGTGEGGNCFRQLARQLIAARFNQEWGATCAFASTNISAALTQIGTKIIKYSASAPATPSCTTGPSGNQSTVNGIQDNLDLFNNGYPSAGCPLHCTGAPQLTGMGSSVPLAPKAAKKASWGTLKEHYR